MTKYVVIKTVAATTTYMVMADSEAQAIRIAQTDGNANIILATGGKAPVWEARELGKGVSNGNH